MVWPYPFISFPVKKTTEIMKVNNLKISGCPQDRLRAVAQKKRLSRYMIQKQLQQSRVLGIFTKQCILNVV